MIVTELVAGVLCASIAAMKASPPSAFATPSRTAHTIAAYSRNAAGQDKDGSSRVSNLPDKLDMDYGAVKW